MSEYFGPLACSVDREFGLLIHTGWSELPGTYRRGPSSTLQFPHAGLPRVGYRWRLRNP